MAESVLSAISRGVVIRGRLIRHSPSYPVSVAAMLHSGGRCYSTFRRRMVLGDSVNVHFGLGEGSRVGH